MAVVTIQEHGKTSTGSPKLKAAGKWYFTARDIGELPAVGSTVDVRIGTFSFKDGKAGERIEAWRPAAANAVPVKADKPYVDEASMRFISNVVGSAITAGSIKEPGQILSWYTAAKSALEGKGTPVPFDDSLPGDDQWNN